MSLFKMTTLLRTPRLLRLSSNGKRLFSDTNAAEKFKEAVKKLGSLQSDPGNEAKLQLYALYKQATVGMCNSPKPGMLDFVGKVKWEAWSNLKEMSQNEAQSNYVEIVNKLAQIEAPGVTKEMSQKSNEDVISTVDGRIHKIILNRPTKKNALTMKMYDLISDSLKEASTNDTSIAVLTGTGDFFCSGNDITVFASVDPSRYDETADEGGELLKRFVASIIDFPKPLIAFVNGPAVGVMVTTLALFDAVYASDKATFHTPFSLLGQSPEGCSSYTFPLTMGHTKACEMLILNRKLTAHEAKQVGLVTDVYPSLHFQDEVWKKIREFSELPPESLKLSKCLMREHFKPILHAVNERECQLLVGRWKSKECQSAVFNFLQKKSML